VADDAGGFDDSADDSSDELGACEELDACDEAGACEVLGACEEAGADVAGIEEGSADVEVGTEAAALLCSTVDVSGAGDDDGVGVKDDATGAFDVEAVEEVETIEDEGMSEVEGEGALSLSDVEDARTEEASGLWSTASRRGSSRQTWR